MDFVRRGLALWKMCCKPIRAKDDKCEDEVENMFKTYREVIDEMGKASLSHINRLSLENLDFSRWQAERKHEKVSKLTSEKFPGLKNHLSWVSFLRWQRW